MDRLILATRNPAKLRELRACLADVPLWLETPPGLPDVPEAGTTFEENALLKARAVAARYGTWALADDSGLEVDVLGGRPGVYSSRYGGPGATDEERNALLLREMNGVPEERRTARYRAVVAVATPDGSAWTFTGVCEGQIAREPRGAGGFGYDPIFCLPERGQRMAELSPEEKNRISHRAQALRQARCFLRQLMAGEITGITEDIP
ncbi:MAG: RdgB/HAM1 family non-canonical purine NTP pyrophosphatase [Armatimonadetes bacterium]|nr:RdgB/HAM1 family non-canonical purine NTP pyrophosphatase [Armatimonadota bacterium]